MMPKEKVRRFVFECAVLIVFSIGLFILGSIISGEKLDERIQFIYDRRFENVLPADRYSEIESELLSGYSNIKHVYSAYDEEGTVTGYVLDTVVEDDEGKTLHILTGVTHDGERLTGLKHIADEEDPIGITEDEINAVSSQTIGKQIPVSLNKDESDKDETISQVSRIRGLHDGIYFAQAKNKDSNGYIDYVEIEVTDGLITKVQWDALNVDRTTQNRREASLSGAYTVSGESWANQAYNLCHAFLDIQDPTRLAMKSDGKTEIIENVTTDIRPFVDLVEECIDNSRAGFDKEAYIAEQKAVLNTLFEGSADELGVMTKDGLMVYSFHEYPNLFSLYDENGGYIKELTIREMATGPDNLAQEGYDYEEEEITNEKDDTYSAEDGYIPGSGRSIMTDSVDGLPMSEIRTFIDGFGGDREHYSYVITGINTDYKFLKDYLNWMA